MKLPEKVEVIEVGPRDGFQNIQTYIEKEDKMAIIDSLIATGLKHVEVTSFVHPKWVPQMKDSAEIVTEVVKKYRGEIEIIALVPNLFGARKAKEYGVDTMTYVISVSEQHNKANVNRTTDESFGELEKILGELDREKVNLALATTFGCPFGEKIEVEKTIRMAKRGLELGINKVVLADTIGVGNPRLVDEVLEAVLKEIPLERVVMHLHDTRGMALANTLIALQHGVYQFESAVGGLGGCPFAPGAAGNVGTEDVVNMLSTMGIQTDVSQQKLKETVAMVIEKVDAPVTSHMSRV